MPFSDNLKISISSFDMFVLSIIILAAGLFIYLHFKNKNKVVRHVDQKAGDEGED